MSLSTPPEVVKRGQTLYKQNCESCHGKYGRGDGVAAADLSTRPSDFTNQAFMAEAASQNLYQSITSGITPDMPAYSSQLDDNDRLALVAYLRSLTFNNPATTVSSYPPPATSVPSIASAYPYPGPQAYPNPVATAIPRPTATSEIIPTGTFVGTVSVQLVNGSGGEVPSDASITLYGFDDMQNTYSETLTTGANGLYVFSNVEMFEGRAFLAGAEYGSATYGSDIAVVDPTNPDLKLQITIYDTTTDVSVLTTDRVHLLFDFSNPDVVQVVEVFIISNPTTETVVAPIEYGTVVTFPLPEGYSNLQFQEGELGDRYIEVSNGFADTVSVNPGERQYQVTFAYDLPYNRKLNFVQSMFLPTNAVVVMVPDNGVRVDSKMLEDGGTRDYQNTSYRMYNGESLIAGSPLEFTLSGTPRNTGANLFSPGTMQNLAIGLAVFGVALVAAGLLLYRRYQRRTAAQAVLGDMDIAAPSTGQKAAPEDQETLMDAIIALDDQYHAGNLPREAYLERRAALKEKLRNIEQV
jgi:cytochrome c553